MKVFNKPMIPNQWEREMEFSDVLMAMESRGVKVDQLFVKTQIAIGEARTAQIYDELGSLRPTSPNDLKELFQRINLPLLPEHRTATGAPSFNKAAMEDYDRILESRADMGKASNTAKLILEYRGWDKTVSANYRNFLKFLSPDGRLRTQYNQNGAKTTRLSSEKPALQQLPRKSDKPWNGKVKCSFIPETGYILMTWDYSQLEYRLAAGYAEMWHIIEVFNRSKNPEMWTKQDRDVFLQLCVQRAIELTDRNRQMMKTTTYASLYLASKLKVAITLGEDIPPAVVAAYFDKYSPYYTHARQYVDNTSAGQFYDQWAELHAKMLAHAYDVNGKARRTMRTNLWSGRVRHLQFASETRKAYNSVIQGGGAEIVKSAMIRLFKEVDNPDCRMVMQVHDSITFEIKEGKVDYYAPIIEELMTSVEREVDFGVFFAVEPECWN